MVRPAFKEVLNRCERVTVVQTQDRCFSKMGCRTASSQGQVAFEKGGCSLSLLRWELAFCGVLIESHELNRKFCHEPQGNPFVQPHSIPFDVRHNLLSSRESASSSYKAAYPFVQGSEFAAVQIIAVDSVRKSGCT